MRRTEKAVKHGINIINTRNVFILKMALMRWGINISMLNII